jgi:hypothetical protein
VKIEYFENLINLAVPNKKWFLLHKLCKDATNRPNINSQAVLALAQ